MFDSGGFKVTTYQSHSEGSCFSSYFLISVVCSLLSRIKLLQYWHIHSASEHYSELVLHDLLLVEQLNTLKESHPIYPGWSLFPISYKEARGLVLPFLPARVTVITQRNIPHQLTLFQWKYPSECYQHSLRQRPTRIRNSWDQGHSIVMLQLQMYPQADRLLHNRDWSHFSKAFSGPWFKIHTKTGPQRSLCNFLLLISRSYISRWDHSHLFCLVTLELSWFHMDELQLVLRWGKQGIKVFTRSSVLLHPGCWEHLGPLSLWLCAFMGWF